VDKILKEELSAREVSSRVQRLFHESLGIILEPLKEAGRTGIEVAWFAWSFPSSLAT
jgi:hypothetical protein